MLSRWLYRSRQFFVALLGRVSSEDMREARRVLGPSLFPMFARLPGQYRLHAINVYRRVREAGCTDPAVLQAALLHDAGKLDPAGGRYVTILHRVAIVLLKAVPPGRAVMDRLAGGRSPRGAAGLLLYPFYLSKHHAALGAQEAAAHGASAELVHLIAAHHDPRQDSPPLRALRAADESS